MPLFGKKRNPKALVNTVKTCLTQLLGSEDKVREKASDELDKALQDMKILLFGDEEKAPNEKQCLKLAEELIGKDLMLELIMNITVLGFESRKNVAFVYNNLMRRNCGGFADRYILANLGVIDSLVAGYENVATALQCGSMLRESLRQPGIASHLLSSPLLWRFFDSYLRLKEFDIASDAFATFQSLLMTHKTLVAKFLTDNFDAFFGKYLELLDSGEYVTVRQALKLLGDLLLDRAFIDVARAFTGERNTLKTVMTLMRSRQRTIRYEAFHLFKVFVANPDKSPPVLRILLDNRAKLIEYLRSFLDEREDERFLEERGVVIRSLQALAPAGDAATAPGDGPKKATEKA